MKDFIITQYKLWKSGGKSIDVDKLNKLIELYLTDEDKHQLGIEVDA